MKPSTMKDEDQNRSILAVAIHSAESAKTPAVMSSDGGEYAEQLSPSTTTSINDGQISRSILAATVLSAVSGDGGEYAERLSLSTTNNDGQTRRSILAATLRSAACVAILLFFVAAVQHASKKRGRGPTVEDHTKLLSIRDEQSPSPAVAHNKPHLAKSVHFIGERHSGTNWIFNHLTRCFADKISVHMGYTRFKHWFQFDDLGANHTHRHAVVVAQFRNSYDWVDSMRRKHHSAPEHSGLEWKEYVTKPWTMERPPKDEPFENSTGPVCGQHFSYKEVVPCSDEVFQKRGGHPRYELKVDGSGEPYESIIDLRRDKLRNFLEVETFYGVTGLIPVRYEDMVTEGSASLLEAIEEATGIKAKCRPKPIRNLTTRQYDAAYLEWMNDHVDWSTEALLGYGKCRPNKSDGTCEQVLSPLIDWHGRLPVPKD